jgi:subtilisin family serine protease
MKRIVFASFFLCATGVLSACGGGGGGEASSGGSTIDQLAATFESTEYNNQAGLGLINASHAYAQASLAAVATAGSGQVVAIVDTGIDVDHADLAGNIAPGGFDFVDSTTTITDPNGHGTHVGGIVAAERNGTLTHGVAFNAKILPIRIFNESGFLLLSDAQVATAIDYARAQGAAVHNNSWGSSTPVTAFTVAAAETQLPASLDAYRRNATAGVVTVFAAGNNRSSQVSLRPGLPLLFPELGDHWVAVVGVDTSGDLPAYTNLCGVAAAWCIAAPGGGDSFGSGILSTQTGGGVTRKSGTSMAAPHVAGAIAVLQDLFPGSTSAEILNRMFVTADKSGAFGDPAIFGNGMLDLKAASEPVEAVGIRAGSEVTGASFDIAQTTLSAGGAIGNGLRAGLDGVNLAVFDSLNAAFEIELGALIGTSEPVASLADLRRGFGGTALTQTNLGQFGRLGLAYRQSDDDPLAEDRALDRARYARRFGDGGLITASYNETPAGHFGLEADGRVSAAETGAPNAFAAPYLGLVDNDHYTAAGTIPTGIGGTLLRVGAFRGETADTGNADRSDGYGALAELVIPVANGGHLGLTVGQAVEDDRFLAWRHR